MKITYNTIASINMNRSLLELTNQLSKINKAIETGSTVNKVSDNHAIYNITQRAKDYASVYEKYSENAQIGVSLADTGLNAISEMQTKFASIRSLLEQANTDSISSSQRAALQSQVDALMQEITNTRTNTKFNDLAIFELKGQYDITQETTGSFNQLTIDDFENVTTETLDGVEFQKGEKDGDVYYFIENVDQLRETANSENNSAYHKNFVFLSDIDLDGVTWGIYQNTSIIDGNGHKITNYSTSFFFIENNYGTIKNLAIENASFSGNGSLFVYGNYGTIDKCYIKDSFINGLDYGTRVFSLLNYGTISNSYITNTIIEGEDGSFFASDGNGTIENCYEFNNNTEDIDYGFIFGYCTKNNCYASCSEYYSVYRDASWFASDEAATALGDAFEFIEGNDHPTLKCENPIKTINIYTPIDNTKRIQTGESSYLTIDTTFYFDDNFSFSTASQEDAAASLTRLETVLSQLEEKTSDLTVYKNNFVNSAESSQSKIKSANNTIFSLTGFDKDKIQEQKEEILSKIENTKALQIQINEFNMQMCQMLIMSAINTASASSSLFSQDSLSWLTGLIRV